MAINPYDPDSPGAGGRPRRRSPWYVYVEDALILLAILALWPTVLRKQGPWTQAIQIVTLAVLVVIGVVRIRRIFAARRKAEDDARRL